MAECAQVDLVGVGLNATDILLSLPEYPQRGSKVEYDSQSILPGGQTASTVVACQRWGMRTRYVGKLGDDSAAQVHHHAFAAADVDARIVTAPGAPSAQSIILIDAKGERTVLGRRDVRVTLEPHELDREWIVTARALHVDGHDTAAATRAAQWAREAGIPVVGDLDEIYPGVDDLLECVDYLIVSRDFPGRLTGEGNLETALREMMRRTGCKLAAATLGEDGVLAWDGAQLLHRPAFHVQVADTTGAGDIFHAGMIYAMFRGWALERQLDFACAAAALNCKAIGARGNIETVAAIEEMMATGVRRDAASYVSAPV